MTSIEVSDGAIGEIDESNEIILTYKTIFHLRLAHARGDRYGMYKGILRTMP